MQSYAEIKALVQSIAFDRTLKLYPNSIFIRYVPTGQIIRQHINLDFITAGIYELSLLGYDLTLEITVLGEQQIIYADIPDSSWLTAYNTFYTSYYS